MSSIFSWAAIGSLFGSSKQIEPAPHHQQATSSTTAAQQVVPAGAIDVIAVERGDGSIACGPFHVRLGKAAQKDEKKSVKVRVNNTDINLFMKLGEAGEAFFLEKTKTESRKKQEEDESKRGRARRIRTSSTEDVPPPRPPPLIPLSLLSSDSDIVTTRCRSHSIPGSGELMPSSFFDASHQPSSPSADMTYGSIDRHVLLMSGDHHPPHLPNNSNNNNNTNNACGSINDGVLGVIIKSPEDLSLSGSLSGSFSIGSAATTASSPKSIPSSPGLYINKSSKNKNSDNNNTSIETNTSSSNDLQRFPSLPILYSYEENSDTLNIHMDSPSVFTNSMNHNMVTFDSNDFCQVFNQVVFIEEEEEAEEEWGGEVGEVQFGVDLGDNSLVEENLLNRHFLSNTSNVISSTTSYDNGTLSTAGVHSYSVSCNDDKNKNNAEDDDDDDDDDDNENVDADVRMPHLKDAEDEDMQTRESMQSNTSEDDANRPIEDISLEEILPGLAQGGGDVSDAESYMSMSQDEDEREWTAVGEGGESLSSLTKPRYRFKKVLVPTKDQLIGLKSVIMGGKNDITYDSEGCPPLRSELFLWPNDARIVVIDLEGAITTSEAAAAAAAAGQQAVKSSNTSSNSNSNSNNYSNNGILSTLFFGSSDKSSSTPSQRDRVHAGFAQLITDISNNGYKILYLTTNTLKSQDQLDELFSVSKLPPGPVVNHPEQVSSKEGTLMSRPEIFKAAVMRGLRTLFSPSENRNPFYACFGQNEADLFAHCGVPPSKIFVVDPKGDIHTMNSTAKRSFSELHIFRNEMFPPFADAFARRGEYKVHNVAVDDRFSDQNFWSIPIDMSLIDS